MKIPWTTFSIVLALGAGLWVGRWTVSPTAGKQATDSAAGVQEYTCSMHPQVRQPQPGKCPLCAMDLIPASAQGHLGERQIRLSPHARALARIVTAPVEREIPEIEVRLFGRVQPDESRLRSISARFPARIERLYVNYTGLQVQAGDHLAAVYSPELITAQSELQGALRHADARTARAAGDKLRLWGFDALTLQRIGEAGTPWDTLDMDAPLGGFVLEKRVNEGDYVNTGDVMFRIADLSTVWILLDAYELDKPWLRYGQAVSLTVEALPGRMFEGRIAFIPPSLDPLTRTFKIRINLDNAQLLLRPGMFVTATVKARYSRGGVLADSSLAGKWISPMHPEIVRDEPGACDVCGMDLVPADALGYVMDAREDPPLLVPASAVLRTGRRALVYVEVPDSEEPTYEGREILLGPRAGDRYVVESGLEPGERVVVHGAFRIDSAQQLMAKPSMMSPRSPDASPDLDTSADLQARTGHLAGAYVPVWKALADDDLSGAKSAMGELLDALEDPGEPEGPAMSTAFYQARVRIIRDAGNQMLEAPTLRLARRPFEVVSNALIQLVEALGLPGDQRLRRAFCPMAFGGRRADWIQPDEPLLNPYFGEAMLRCGDFERWLVPGPVAPPPQVEPAPRVDPPHPQDHP